VLRRAAKRTEAETQQLLQLHAQAAEVAEAIDRAQPAQLEPWLQRTTASAVDAVRRFATGLSD
jgi:hypothetical protein